jgi:transcriptional regulator with XRE-family HTH domain
MAKGERIKSRREQLGITQISLADKVGISKQNLYKYENNIITNIPSDVIEKIADALNCTPGYLMGWDDNSKKSPPSEAALTEGDKMMLELFRKIPVDRQAEALDLLRVALRMQKKP